MKLAALKELLVRRVDEEQLQELIKALPENVLGQIVIEALNKMAKKGASANHAITLMAGHSLPAVAGDHPHELLDAALLHDNLSHHLSKYKSALTAGNRSVADQHLEQVMRGINLGTKLEGVTDGKIRVRSGSTAATPGKEGLSLIPSTPWEMNYSGSRRKPAKTPGGLGEFHQNPKDWGRTLTSERKSHEMFPDYHYMEMPPHPHAKHDRRGNEGAYPFHDLQINGRHVDIKDEPHSGKFESHVLDAHPATAHSYTHSGEVSKEDAQGIANAHKEWMQSPALDSWLGAQAENHDPNRGTNPSTPIHTSVTENPHDLVQGRRPEGINQGHKPAAPIPEFTMDLNEPTSAAPQANTPMSIEDQIKQIRGK